MKHKDFFHMMWLHRNAIDDDPMMYAVRLVFSYDDQGSRYITYLTFNKVDDADDANGIWDQLL